MQVCVISGGVLGYSSCNIHIEFHKCHYSITSGDHGPVELHTYMLPIMNKKQSLAFIANSLSSVLVKFIYCMDTTIVSQSVNFSCVVFVAWMANAWIANYLDCPGKCQNVSTAIDLDSLSNYKWTTSPQTGASNYSQLCLMKWSMKITIAL